MVYSLQNKLLLGITLPLTIPMLACGGAATQAQINELKAQIIELSKNYARLQVRVDNNSQRLAVLMDHPQPKNGGESAPPAAGLRPPDHLQVVTLGPDSMPEQSLSATTNDVPADVKPEEIIRKAAELMLNSDFDNAEVQYLKFMSYFPNHAEVAKVKYNLAQIAVKRNDYRGAAQLIDDLVLQFPNSDIVPDALYEKAGALESSGDKEGFTATLKELINRYPETIAAKKARVRLMRSEEEAY